MRDHDGELGAVRSAIAPGKLRVWRVATLTEHFRVNVDERGTVRCDHAVSLFGLRVLRLHYRIEETR